MSDYDGPQLRQIYTAALEISEGPEREAFLLRQCAGNDDLFAQAQKLLDSSGDSNTPLTEVFGMLEGVNGELQNAMPAGDFAQSPELEAGARVGNYEIVKPIGSGGMAVVYLANQLAPIQRWVALKLLKPGMDSSELLARFKLEQEALARMDHPNVSTVFDAGLTDIGRPYFVMELVDGVAVDEYCDAGSIGLPDRLKLFQSICRAVHHAHEKSIVHRDLKPSNLLVTLVDGVPIVKVIDFGIAKAMEVPLEQTKFTDFAQLLGTPLYMSPEMVAFEPGGIDRRSDVYALGAVLCQLLTGVPPFDRETMRSAGFDGMRHLIRNVAPQRPSLRGVVASGLNSPLPTALDWIVLKALEKSPQDRYQTAADLAEDVERFLTHQPTRAAPPSIPGRIYKLLRRHPAVSTIACLTTLFACLGTWLYLDKLDSDKKRQQAETQAVRLVQQRQTELAEQRRREESALDTAEANALQQMIIALNDVDLAMMSTFDLPRESDGTLLGYETDDASEYSFRQIMLDLANPMPIRTFKHPAGVNDVCLSSDKTQMVTVCDDHKVRLWDLETGKLLRTIGEHSFASQAVAFAPDGSRIVSGDKDGIVKVWDFASGEELFSYGPSPTGVESIEWSPDGNIIAVGHRYEYVRLLDPDLNLLHTIGQDHPRYVQLIFSPDSKRLVIPGSEAELCVESWDTSTFERVSSATVPVVSKIEAMCCISGDAQRVMITNGDTTGVHLANVSSGATVRIGESRGRNCLVLASSPDGKYVVGGFPGGKIEAFRVAGAGDGTQLQLAAFVQAHSGENGGVMDLTFLDAKHFVSASQDGEVHLWNIDDILPFSTFRIGNGKYLVRCQCEQSQGAAWINDNSAEPTADVLYFDREPHAARFQLPKEQSKDRNYQWLAETAYCRTRELLAASTTAGVLIIDDSMHHTLLPKTNPLQGDQSATGLQWLGNSSNLEANFPMHTEIWSLGDSSLSPKLYANWELQSRTLAQPGSATQAVYQTDFNPHLETRVVRRRDLSGVLLEEWVRPGLMATAVDTPNGLIAIAGRAGFEVRSLTDDRVVLSGYNAPTTQAVAITDDGRILIAHHGDTRFSVWHIPTGRNLGKVDVADFLPIDANKRMAVDVRHFAIVESLDDTFRLGTIRTTKSESSSALRYSSLWDEAADSH